MKKNTFIKCLQSSWPVLCTVCVAIFLFGCARVSIQSARDPSFSNPMNKLFIILNHGQIDNIDSSYTPYLAAALKDEFSKEGLEVAIRVAEPLVLDDSIYKFEIASYEPDGVMTITANGWAVSEPSGGLTQIIYDVSLFDSSKSKRIWRALIDASGGLSAREKRMKLVATDLVNQLKEQKLISSEPRVKWTQL